MPSLYRLHKAVCRIDAVIDLNSITSIKVDESEKPCIEIMKIYARINKLFIFRNNGNDRVRPFYRLPADKHIARSLSLLNHELEYAGKIRHPIPAQGQLRHKTDFA